MNDNYPAGVTGKTFDGDDYIEASTISSALGTIEEALNEMYAEEAIVRSFPGPYGQKVVTAICNLYTALEIAKKSLNSAENALMIAEDNPYD